MTNSKLESLHPRRMEGRNQPFIEMKPHAGRELFKRGKTSSQDQGDSFGLDLPIGEEYEQKQQRLKEDLLDYQRFLFEKNNKIRIDSLPQSHLVSLPIKERRSAKTKLREERNLEYNLFLRGQEHRYKQAGSPVLPPLRATQGPGNFVPLRRDVATLTEPIYGLPMQSRPQRNGEHLDAPWVDYSSANEEIERLQRQRRELRDNSLQSLRAHSHVQSRLVNEKNLAEEATGLMIGSVKEEEDSQRKKQCYRQELLQQIEEQRQNKRKEKELGLRVAATGAVDPEKRADRIKQFETKALENKIKRKNLIGSELSRAEYSASSGRRFREDSLPRAPSQEFMPPEKPHVAFVSPSQELNNPYLQDFRATPSYSDNRTSLLRTLGEMVAPRVAAARPPLAPSFPNFHQTPYDQEYYYNGARIPLDLHPSDLIPFLFEPDGPPGPPIPPETHRPVVQAPPGGFTQVVKHAGAVQPQFIKHSAASYQDALKQQIKDRQQRRQKEKAENEQYNARIEAESKVYDPWGRGGAGAPLRDPEGNLISDLKKMHKANTEAYESGGNGWKIPSSSRTETAEPAEVLLSKRSVYGRGNVFTETPSPQQLRQQANYQEFLRLQVEEKKKRQEEERELLRLKEEKEERRLAQQRASMLREFEEEQAKRLQKDLEVKGRQRQQQCKVEKELHNTVLQAPPGDFIQVDIHTGAVPPEFTSPEKAQQPKLSAVSYQEALKQQVEEKRKRQKEERELQRLEEEKEEKRLAQQRASMLREFEEEHLELKMANAQLRKRAEEQQKNADSLSNHSFAEAENKALYEVKQTPQVEVQCAPSPPVPALQKKLRQRTQRPLSIESHMPPYSLSTCSLSTPPSPPVPALKNEIRATEEKQTVIRELSALRSRLKNEQRRLEEQFMQASRTELFKSRPKEKLPQVFFGVERRHKNGPTKRPASHSTRQVNTQNLQEFNRLKNKDSACCEEVRQTYPDTPTDDHSLDIQQQALLRQQERTISQLRKGKAAADGTSEQPHHLQRWNATEKYILFDSERVFIDTSHDLFPSKSRPDSRAMQTGRKRDVSDAVFIRPDSAPSTHSLSSTEIERLRERVKKKMTCLNHMMEHNWRSGDAAGEEKEEVWSGTPFTDCSNSIDTIATELWLRPSSSETLKRLSRSHSGQDWEGPYTYHG